MAELRVIVAGCRTCNDKDFVFNTLDDFFERKLHEGYKKENISIVSGGCRGIDYLGELYAKEHGYELKIFNADWEKYGRGAGPIRNESMIEYAMQGDGYITAFWDGKSAGTGSLLAIGRLYGIGISIYKV